MKVLFCLLISCLCGLFFAGCDDKLSTSCVIKIMDMANDDSMPIELSYDKEGRLTGFGGALITYKPNEIIVDNLKPMFGYGRFFRIVYKLKNGRVVSGEARCEEVVFGKMVEVRKESTYSYFPHKITMNSKSFSMEDDKLLKSVDEVREFRKDGILQTVRISDSDWGNGTISYKYDSNLICSANINIQAFSYTAGGMDDMLVYLLNLNRMPRVNILPDEVCYIYQNGLTHLYNENFSLEDDRLIKMEVMLNYEILVSRINFEYKK